MLGFIFFKYLSEKSVNFAKELLDGEDITFLELDESNDEHIPYIEEIKKHSINEVGYTLSPSQLFHTIAERDRQGEFILDDFSANLKAIEQSTLGSESTDDFANLFEDLDLNSTNGADSSRNCLASLRDKSG